MAFGAGHLGMHANQGKGRLGVFEMPVDTFFAIVTGATIGRVGAEVGHHESSIHLEMTIGAITGFKVFVASEMTGLTGEGCASRSFAVRSSGKPQPFVGEIVQGHLGQRGVGAAMFGVTFPTGQSGLLTKQNSMEFMRVGKFQPEIRMTAQTAILH